MGIVKEYVSIFVLPAISLNAPIDIDTEPLFVLFPSAVNVAVYTLLDPAKLLNVPPTTVISLAAKSLTFSLIVNVKISVLLAMLSVEELARVIETMVGLTASTSIVRVFDNKLGLPAASVNCPERTLISDDVLLGPPVNVAAYINGLLDDIKLVSVEPAGLEIEISDIVNPICGASLNANIIVSVSLSFNIAEPRRDKVTVGDKVSMGIVKDIVLLFGFPAKSVNIS
jgi:hypothetical protein